MTAAVIYNPACIDSVIAAAYLMARMVEPARAMQAGTKFDNGYDEFHWVGVEPSKRTLSALKMRKHYGYFIDASTLEAGTSLMFEAIVDRFTVVNNELMFDSELPPLPKLVLGALMRTQDRLRDLWWIGSLVEQMKLGENQSMEEQAVIYGNYRAALDALGNHAKPFVLSDLPSPDYPSFIKDVKRQLTSMYETTDVVIGNELYKVPVLNVGAEYSPWFIKLLNQTFSFVVTYEHRRGRTAYSVFSKIAGFDKVILSQVMSERHQVSLDYKT